MVSVNMKSGIMNVVFAKVSLLYSAILRVLIQKPQPVRKEVGPCHPIEMVCLYLSSFGVPSPRIWIMNSHLPPIENILLYATVYKPLIDMITNRCGNIANSTVLIILFHKTIRVNLSFLIILPMPKSRAYIL